MLRFAPSSLLVLLFLLFPAPGRSQQDPVAAYMAGAGVHAYIFSGAREIPYSSREYTNTPYYPGADPVAAQALFRGDSYPGLSARLDLYQDRLSISIPGSGLAVLIDDRKVGSLRLGNEEFVYLIAERDGSPESGYYQMLHRGRQASVLVRKHYTLTKTRFNEAGQLTFDYSERFYLLHEGKFHPLRAYTSFSRLFPRFKKQIKRFIKSRDLRSATDKQAPLTALGAYCDELLTQTSR